MDNFGNSFNNDFDENYNLSPSPRRRISCSQTVSFLGLLVAILAFLFGDNILGRGRLETTSTNETINATATNKPDDYRLAIDNLVWEYSLDEPKIYYIEMIAEEQLSNFNLEVVLKFNDEQDEFHGVVFRRVDENQYYSFEISPLGEYVIYRNGENSKSNLVGPVNSNIILRGKDQFNKLGVKATNSVFEFSINDTLITSLTESVLSAGGIGLYTCTCNGSDRSSVSFYDLTISSLP
jgi:hypothetical protein